MHRLLISLIGLSLSIANICLMPMAQATDVSVATKEHGLQTSIMLHSTSSTCEGADCMLPITRGQIAQSNILPLMRIVAVPSAIFPNQVAQIAEKGISIRPSTPLLAHTNTVVLRE